MARVAFKTALPAAGGACLPPHLTQRTHPSRWVPPRTTAWGGGLFLIATLSTHPLAYAPSPASSPPLCSCDGLAGGRGRGLRAQIKCHEPGVTHATRRLTHKVTHHLYSPFLPLPVRGDLRCAAARPLVPLQIIRFVLLQPPFKSQHKVGGVVVFAQAVVFSFVRKHRCAAFVRKHRCVAVRTPRGRRPIRLPGWRVGPPARSPTCPTAPWAGSPAPRACAGKGSANGPAIA